MLRLLVYGVPSTPTFEVCEIFSKFHNLPFITFEISPNENDSYFTDDIPEIDLDTNDSSSGSGQCQLVRDMFSVEKTKHIGLIKPIVLPYKSIDDTEYEILCRYDQWVCCTEIPDERLIDLCTHVIFLNSGFDNIVQWFSGRRFCPTCGNVHHLIDKPCRLINVCDRCGTDLIFREEDSGKYIKAQFLEWSNLFWRFKNKSVKRDCHRVYCVDKFDSIDELVVKVHRDFKGFIEKEGSKNWYSNLEGIGPEDFDVDY